MSDQLARHVTDLLAPLGPVRIRRMFGGYGVYLDRTMFGLIADDTLYFKVDETTAARYEAAGLPPFSYERGDGRTVAMTYRQAPPEALDDSDALCEWARDALAVAGRAAAAKKRR